MKNKKGQLDILIMVFLTLAITGISLFLFVSSGNNSTGSIQGALVVNDLYLEEEAFIYELKSLADGITIKEEFETIYREPGIKPSNELLYKYHNSFLKSLNNEGSFVKVEEEKLKILLKDFEFYLEKEGVKVKHIRDISFELDLPVLSV